MPLLTSASAGKSKSIFGKGNALRLNASSRATRSKRASRGHGGDHPSNLRTHSAGIAMKTKAYDWLYGKAGYALAA
ncbi:hypothetical protein [Mesorhizobium muleiense]|uniref:Uncharacterized protein n=1 Tax=Mesorhizobium muleiense TaxID=1004279 RepID=A0A1G8SE02_9HYPH|nr:hypothetical protein [Mesorhizobium muleiense]MCF6101095.1 hypothetical protein [Mesorhizobium muleiense]SDJ26975.1 hypothetical protein SAMN05428953_105174 [Mesorhizobium muleiense]